MQIEFEYKTHARQRHLGADEDAAWVPAGVIERDQ